MLKCAVCQVPESKDTKILQCSSCKSVGYCSINHQKQDWPNHKKSCSLVSVLIQKVEVKSNGKDKKKKEEKTFKTVAVAPRDFAPGEIIMDERPLFNIPFAHCCGPSSIPAPSSSDDGSKSSIIKFINLIRGNDIGSPDRQCFTCGVIVQPQQKCSKCSAPICSSGCQKADLHAENECPVFSSSSSPPLVFGQHSGGEENCMMKRAILIRIENVKKNQPEVWEAIKSFLDPKLKFNDDYEMLQWLMKHKGFVHFQPLVPNADDEDTGKFVRLVSLYKIGGQIEHSCSPNTTFELGHFPDFKMRVRASVAIKKGEHLYISRLALRHSAFEGTIFRREAIKRLYNYTCYCKMCSDVTELGSYQSAVTCPKCQDSPAQKRSQKKKNAKKAESKGKLPGYFLPESSEPGVNWVCAGCGDATGEQRVIEFVRRMETQEGWDIMETFKPLMHPNHFLIQVFTPGMMAELIKNGKHEEYAESTKYMLGILDKTLPGLSPQRAGLEHNLSLCYLECLEACSLPENMPEDRIRKALEMIKECGEYQRNALPYFENHPPERGEKVYNVGVSIKQEMERLRVVEEKIKRRYNIRE